MRFDRLPSSFFSIVLGLVGLGGIWRLATRLWGLPAPVGEAIIALSCAIWVVLAVAFVLRHLRHPDDLAAELAHPIQCCFWGLAFVATLLLVPGVRPYSMAAAWAFFAVGIVGHVGFVIWRVGSLWQGGRPAEAMTPVLYLPLVAGNFASAIACASLGLHDLGLLFLGAGLFSWLAIESTVWMRLFAHESMAPAVRPLLGIQLAPSVVGLVAYLSLQPGPLPVFAYALMGYGLLQYLVLLRLMPWFAVSWFSPAWWAFSFGVTAAAGAAMLMVINGAGGVMIPIGVVLFALANVAILILAVATVRFVAREARAPAQ